MIDWAEYLDALRSDPISKRQKFVKVVNVERNMLHGALGDGFTPVACMCDAPLHFISIFWVLDKGNIGAFGKFSETVEAPFHSMHPVQGLRRAPEYFREKAELSFHVVSRYSEVVDAVWVKGHNSRLRLGGHLMAAPFRRQSKATSQKLGFDATTGSLGLGVDDGSDDTIALLSATKLRGGSLSP